MTGKKKNEDLKLELENEKLLLQTAKRNLISELREQNMYVQSQKQDEIRYKANGNQTAKSPPKSYPSSKDWIVLSNEDAGQQIQI
eukprot:UN09636